MIRSLTTLEHKGAQGMAEHRNATQVRKGYEAMAAGDISWMAENTAPDVVFTQLGRNHIAGRFEGQEKMFGHFGEFVEFTAGDFNFDIRDVLANDEKAVVLIHMSAGRPDGQRLELDEIHVFEFG